MKAVAFLAIICIALVCELVSGSGASSAGGQNIVSPAAAASRKVKILSANPALSKLYRLLINRAGLSADDEDLFAGMEDESYFQKRQQYDDYGHLRFGKRNPKDFDDYGHMRFGK